MSLRAGRWAAATGTLLLGLSVSCSDDETGPPGTGGTTITTTGTGAGTAGTGGTGGGAGGSGAAGGGGGGPVTVCNDDCHFVRAGAQGADDGSDWTNAWTELPADLERGHIYFIAEGAYPAYTFDDAESGTDVIRVLRATAHDHGTDVGWDDSYGAGTASWGPLVFDAPYVELDGRSTTQVVGGFEGTVVDISGHHVTVRGCDLDGNFQTDGSGDQTDGTCSGVTIGADDVTLASCLIHDAADDGIGIFNANRVSVVGNRVFTLHGCGTDNGCGPCYNGHSDGFELYNVKDSEIVGNMVYDIASTSTFFFGGWADELGGGPSEYCGNILLANNILYNPQTGFVIYIQDVGGIQVFNNVIWGLRQGAYGGLAIGEHVTDLDLYNNVILSINYAHMGSSYNAAEHRGDYNLFGVSLGQYTDQVHDIVYADPGFANIPDMDGPENPNPVPDDFIPQAGSPMIDAGYGGDGTIVIPSTDFFGDSRDDTPNIGAIERTN